MDKTLRDTGTKPRHDKKNAKQNSGIGINYLASFSLTRGFHFLLFLSKKMEENFEINS